MSACYIALGGNQGDVFSAMEQGLALLHDAEGIRVEQLSPVYETTPVGSDGNAPFLNAAARIAYEGSPLTLLHQLQSVEAQLGRRRTTRWGPRPLDLDLLLFDDRVINHQELTVPHPHLWYRRFVLDPLVEIAAEVVHPRKEIRIGSLRERLLARPFPVEIIGGEIVQRREIGDALCDRFPEVVVRITDESDARSPDKESNVAAHTVSEHSAGDHDVRNPTGIIPVIVLVLSSANAPVIESKSIAQSGRSSINPSGSDLTDTVSLRELPGDLFNAAFSVLTAALDEPRLHKRPLRKMP